MLSISGEKSINVSSDINYLYISDKNQLLGKLNLQNGIFSKMNNNMTIVFFNDDKIIFQVKDRQVLKFNEYENDITFIRKGEAFYTDNSITFIYKRFKIPNIIESIDTKN